MAARIIDGTRVAERMWAEVGQQVGELAAAGRKLKLAAVLVGEAPASRVYARSQAKQCDRMKIDYQLIRLPPDVDQARLLGQIEELNHDASVTGVMVHQPLPAGIDVPAIQLRIDPYKDVEGVNPANIGMVFYDEPIIAPCTALAAVEMIREAGIELRGANAAVVGQGPIVGLPISVLLIQQLVTVTCCHIATRDLKARTREADILVVAAGKPGLITAHHVKPGAVVIDVGINQVKSHDAEGNEVTRTVGDVDFEAVREVAGAITPVPGGVGPVTVTTLLRNTVVAAQKQKAHGR